MGCGREVKGLGKTDPNFFLNGEKVMAVVSLGLLLAVIMPDVPWAIVATTVRFLYSSSRGPCSFSLFYGRGFLVRESR